MLAGILSMLTRGGGIEEALRLGTAAAAATISLHGTNLATFEPVSYTHLYLRWPPLCP